MEIKMSFKMDGRLIPQKVAGGSPGTFGLATPKSAKHKGLKMQVKTEHRHKVVVHRFSRRPR